MPRAEKSPFRIIPFRKAAARPAPLPQEDDPFAARRSHEVLRPRRATLPIVFTSPHSGREYPPEFVSQSRLGPVALRRSEDAFVDELFGAAPEYGAPLLRALAPRAYVDVNREPFELDEKMFADRLPGHVNVRSKRVAAGLGTVPRVISSGQEIYGRKLRFEEALERIHRHYFPYHRTLRRLIDNRRKRFGYCIVVDCHSMPSVGGLRDPDAEHDRADVVIGDCFGEACAPYITDLIEETLSGFGYVVHRNKPFAGGFTTEHYGDPRNGVHAVQIELNRALYMDEFRIIRTANFPSLADRMTRLVATLGELTTQAMAAE